MSNKKNIFRKEGSIGVSFSTECNEFQNFINLVVFAYKCIYKIKPN